MPNKKKPGNMRGIIEEDENGVLYTYNRRDIEGTGRSFRITFDEPLRRPPRRVIAKRPKLKTKKQMAKSGVKKMLEATSKPPTEMRPPPKGDDDDEEEEDDYFLDDDEEDQDGSGGAPPPPPPPPPSASMRA